MPAEYEVITNNAVAVTLAGQALERLTAIRDSTLPGTALWIAADAAIEATTDIVVELYAPLAERSGT